jgi:hypothetical protein
VALTEMQTLILWALLAKRDGASFQKDIRPEVKKADRDALVSTGLITIEKRGRSGFWLEVTDKGWDWAASHLDANLPKRSSAASLILQAWLTQLKIFMEARGFALAEILAPEHSAEARPSYPEGIAPSRSAHVDYGAVRERVRQAYLNLTGGKLNTRALLVDLREQLKDIHHDVLDEVLKRMHLEEGTTLSGLNNPQEITQLIRDAGLNFKGESMYALWITK